MYRWHATTSKADEEWVDTFPGKETDEVRNSFIIIRLISNLHLPAHPLDHAQEFKAKLKETQAGETDVTTWTFGGRVSTVDPRRIA